MKTKNTPEMNCRISATGVTTAGALRPVRASDEKATPHSVQAVMPSTDTHRKVSHFPAVSGRSRPNSSVATVSRMTVSSTAMNATISTLPAK